LVANTSMHDFRVIAAAAAAAAVPTDGNLALATSEQDLLHCHSGDAIRILTMNPTH